MASAVPGADDATPRRQDTANHPSWWSRVCGFIDTDLSQKTVLIADDEETIIALIEETLRTRIECKTRTASTGDEVIEALKSEPCDILLTDMMMPGLHGLDLIHAAREAAPNTDIIIFTGFYDSFPYMDSIDAGASDIIAKPCSPSEIEGKVLRLFRERLTRGQLLQAEQKYRSLFEESFSSNLLVDAEDMTVLDVNRAFLALLGATHEAVVGKSFAELLKPAERDRMEQSMRLFAKGGRGTIGDIGIQGNGDAEIIADLSVTFIDLPDQRVVLLNLVDMTDRRFIESQLATAAVTDGLTGLSNRRAFDTAIGGTSIRAKRDGTSLSLLMIDLDDFKLCNDSLGHQAGDKLLQNVGKILRGCIRGGGGDEGFRMGGDEFAVLLPGAPAERAAEVAERMRAAFEDSKSHQTTMSIGIAEFSDDMTFESFVRAADSALYAAKDKGKNTICVA